MLLSTFVGAVPRAGPPLLIIGIVVMVHSLRWWTHRGNKVPEIERHIDQLDGAEFQAYVAGLFARRGWRVLLLPPYGGDYGTDLLIERNHKRISVQVKRNAACRATGIAAVQQTIAGRTFYGADGALCISTSYRFSTQARELARRGGVELWERAKFLAYVRGDTAARGRRSRRCLMAGLWPRGAYRRHRRLAG